MRASFWLAWWSTTKFFATRSQFYINTGGRKLTNTIPQFDSHGYQQDLTLPLTWQIWVGSPNRDVSFQVCKAPKITIYRFSTRTYLIQNFISAIPTISVLEKSKIHPISLFISNGFYPLLYYFFSRPAVAEREKNCNKAHFPLLSTSVFYHYHLRLERCI